MTNRFRVLICRYAPILIASLRRYGMGRDMTAATQSSRTFISSATARAHRATPRTGQSRVHGPSRPRSSGDRAPPSGGGGAGSNPAEGTAERAWSALSNLTDMATICATGVPDSACVRAGSSIGHQHTDAWSQPLEQLRPGSVAGRDRYARTATLTPVIAIARRVPLLLQWGPRVTRTTHSLSHESTPWTFILPSSRFAQALICYLCHLI